MIRQHDIRIESLEAIISSDVDIMEEMKDTIKNLVSERKDSTLQMMVEEIDSTIFLQKNLNKTLKEECARLLSAIAEPKTRCSSQENMLSNSSK